MIKTPGVYIEELNAFPNSVVQAATSVPAFIGYVECAGRDGGSLLNQPVRIGSISEYEALFGGAAPTRVRLSADGEFDGIDPATRFFLHPSLRLYFDNGGGPCWIVAAGTYAEAMAGGKQAESLGAKALDALRSVDEPALVLVPDAVLLERDACRQVAQQMLAHCGTLQSRFAILDVHSGDLPRSLDKQSDIISGENGGFRTIDSPYLGYGAAYYPWLNTSLLAADMLDHGIVSDNSVPALQRRLQQQAGTLDLAPQHLQAVLDAIAALASAEPHAARRSGQQLLVAALPAYSELMQQACQALNVLPPGGAMAGVYAQRDQMDGAWTAPANVSLQSVLAPVVSIDDHAQLDLNVPADGKAVDALRLFPGRGTVVWGARTLDGNSLDWRYIPMRRTAIMIGQSVRAALQTYALQANTQQTWTEVQSMLNNFLTQLWQTGALMGSKPDDAFRVQAGLGSTMTAADVLDGSMKVTISVSLMRPAEFIELDFVQAMAAQ